MPVPAEARSRVHARAPSPGACRLTSHVTPNLGIDRRRASRRPRPRRVLTANASRVMCSARNAALNRHSLVRVPAHLAKGADDAAFHRHRLAGCHDEIARRLSRRSNRRRLEIPIPAPRTASVCVRACDRRVSDADRPNGAQKREIEVRRVELDALAHATGGVTPGLHRAHAAHSSARLFRARGDRRPSKRCAGSDPYGPGAPRSVSTRRSVAMNVGSARRPISSANPRLLFLARRHSTRSRHWQPAR